MDMEMNLSSKWIVVAAALLAGCESRAPREKASAEVPVDSASGAIGAVPTDTVTIQLRDTRGLIENSAAAMSSASGGVLFSINDSGHRPELFAIDTTGADRGVWDVARASNRDWEALALGPCGKERCVYIGDVGDNDARYVSRRIYRVREPEPRDSAFRGTLEAERLEFRYPDGPNDVEAMYIAQNGDAFLITKRPVRERGNLRRARVYRVAAAAWSNHKLNSAELVDSLSIVPGSTPLRTISDAALSPDGKHLAVLTYAEVYVYATDASSGRVNAGIAPAVCDIVPLGQPQGEGLTWANNEGRLVFTSEGKRVPLHIATCPLPR
jgi:hypothetical protein